MEICSNCHPFFTGKYKLVDTAGRVDRFRKKYAATNAAKEAEAAAGRREWRGRCRWRCQEGQEGRGEGVTHAVSSAERYPSSRVTEGFLGSAPALLAAFQRSSFQVLQIEIWT